MRSVVHSLILFFLTLTSVNAENSFLSDFRGGQAAPSEMVMPPSESVEIPSFDSTMEEAYDYRLGFRDLIEIQVFGVPELSGSVRVQSNGFVSLPLVGKVKVGGLTVDETEALITDKLAEEYLQDPKVTVFIKEYESQKITVNGMVRSPGVFPMKSRTSLLQAISIAGGLDRLADPSEIVIFRRVPGKGTVGYMVDFEQVASGKVTDPMLNNQDIVVVPESGSKVFMFETVRGLTGFLGFATLF